MAEQMKIADAVAGLQSALNETAERYPEFRDRLQEKNFTVQIQLMDGSFAEHLIFENGHVVLGSGAHSKPDITLSFYSEVDGLTMMKPDKDWKGYLDVINVIKNFRAGWQGPDEISIWFTETLDKMGQAGMQYGTDMGNGVKRYTSNTTGGAVFAYVKDGKIIRVTPIEFDDSDAASWTINARGKSFTPPRIASADAPTLAWKSMVYSKDRLLYPMKRVDFDPNGERNPQNRGISEYERISWDEALDIVAGEIQRVKREYGPGAIMNCTSSHHTWGHLGYKLSARTRFFNNIGSTTVVDNPDSWEGWFWGAMHHWGQSAHNGGGETYGTVQDLLENAEMVVFWSADPEATAGVYAAHEGTYRRRWLKDLGLPCVHIDPFYNHTAAWMGGKWFAPKPGTDNALVFAIAYTWITEDLYDKQYVADRTTGFDKWKVHVLGEDDGIPKTPEWQEEITGLPARNVRALAREWASKKTYLCAGGAIAFGGACRTATGADWARGVVMLMAMQGLGKPGINMGGLQQGTPVNARFWFPGYADGGFSASITGGNASVINSYQNMPSTFTGSNVKQLVPRLKIPEAILDQKTDGYPLDFMSLEGQFQKFEYPAPGHSPVKLWYRYGGSFFGTMTETNRFARALRSPNLETVINQSIWFEGEAKFADVILPACTSFERWDISEYTNCGGYVNHTFTQANHRVPCIQHKCIEPLGESKSDFQIFLDISKRLGMGHQFSEGCTELEWCRRFFYSTDVCKNMSWEEFLVKGYYVVPAPSEELRDPVAYRWFAEGRHKDTPELSMAPADFTEEMGKGLQTQSGKIEFESSSLKRFAPDDEERPPILKYRDSWEGTKTTELYSKYPLQMISPHPRFSFHTQNDGKDAFTNDIKDHRVLVNGHYYWIARINSDDADKRGIGQHDLIKLYNDRGAVICAAQVTERVPPGTIHSYESSSQYVPTGEPGESPDIGGCVNILTPVRMMVKHSHAQAPNSCLIQVEKWEWR